MLSSQRKSILNELSMPEKIAILLIQVGEELTAKIFSYMDTDSITEISRYIAKAKTIDKEVASEVLKEFYSIFQSNKYIRTGGFEYAKEILYKALGPKEAQKIVDKLTKSIENEQNFEFLKKVKPKKLAEFVKNEHPQTIALILSYMDSKNAAEVLSYFSDELRAEVLIRMSNLGDISDDIVKKVGKILKVKLESIKNNNVRKRGIEYVVEVFDKLDRRAAKSAIKYIELVNKALAEKIKEEVFSFEDIIKLDNSSIREILSEVDKNTLMIALKGASGEFKKKFLINMPKISAQAFEEEFQFLGPVKVKEIETAQQKIVDIIKKLIDEGKIYITLNG